MGGMGPATVDFGGIWFDLRSVEPDIPRTQEMAQQLRHP